MVDERIVTVIRKYLRALAGSGLAASGAVVFGSQVTGRTHQWSDIDLIVISPTFDEPIRRKDIELLWIMAARVDSRIEPIPCGERAWIEDDARAIIEIARREGEYISFIAEPETATETSEEG